MSDIADLFRQCVAEVLGPERPILAPDEFFAVLQHIDRNYPWCVKELSALARQSIADHKKDRPIQEIKKSDYFCGIKNSFDIYAKSG